MNDHVLHGSLMHLFCRKQRSRKAAPAQGVRAKAILCLLIVVGLTLHMVHAGPAFAGTDTAELSAAALASEPPLAPKFVVSRAVPHCHSPAPCVFLAVQSPANSRALEPGDWIAGPPRCHRSTIAHRQFRPPRLPAHA